MNTMNSNYKNVMKFQIKLFERKHTELTPWHQIITGEILFTN